MTDSQQDVIITTKNGKKSSIGLITLNRTKALNALNLDMIKKITLALLEWQTNSNIAAVVIQGAGEKAFCAGGDIKSLYLHGKENPNDCMQFFYHEYRLNNIIKNYTKPYIALLHGITMGGGIGVSVHGSHKVAAHNLVFAMPESGIGFFTDIGGSYFLSRCKDNTGLYMALTGNKISCLDAKHIGLVDNILKNPNHSDSFEQIIKELTDTEFQLNNYNENCSIVSNVLTRYSLNINSDSALLTELNENTKNTIINKLELIQNHFNAGSVAAIMQKLKHDDSEWAHKNLKILSSKSPTSLLVIFELLKRGRELNFSDCMKMEYAVAYGFLNHNDFYEGVRAVIVDKDNTPNWDKVDVTKPQEFNYQSYFNNNFSGKLELR